MDAIASDDALERMLVHLPAHSFASPIATDSAANARKAGSFHDPLFEAGVCRVVVSGAGCAGASPVARGRQVFDALLTSGRGQA
jgi:hypothetical protein